MTNIIVYLALVFHCQNGSYISDCASKGRIIPFQDYQGACRASESSSKSVLKDNSSTWVYEVDIDSSSNVKLNKLVCVPEATTYYVKPFVENTNE